MAEQETFTFTPKEAPPEEAEIQRQKAKQLEGDLKGGDKAPEPAAKPREPFFGPMGLTAIATVCGITGAAEVKSSKIPVSKTGQLGDLDEVLVDGLMQAGTEMDAKYGSGAGPIPAEVRYGIFAGALLLVKGRVGAIRDYAIRMRSQAMQPGSQPAPPEQMKSPNFAQSQPDPNRKQ